MKSNKSTLLSMLFLFITVSFAFSQQEDTYNGEGPFNQLIIRGVTLINGNGAPPISPVDIVVEQNKIVKIQVVGYPGVKINEDSLLAAAKDAYKAIKKIPKESNQEAIQGTFQFEEETASIEQTENPNEHNSQDYNYNNDNLNDGLDMFSSVDDDVVNMAELTNRLPIDQQPEFATLLDTGRISFSCM